MTDFNINPRHKRAYKEQYWYAKNFLDQFLELKNYEGIKILEIGTAEAGVLKYFEEKGCECYGLEYSHGRYQNSLFLNKNSSLKLFQGDVCDNNTFGEIKDIKFDVIILRDVIEHLDNKIEALKNIFDLLKKDGKFFISFPTKYSPFAGHQQVFPSKIGKIPYLHLLPDNIYSKIIRMTGLNEQNVDYYLFIKKNRLSIKEFKNIFKEINFEILKFTSFIIRPNYEFRYGIKRLENVFNKIAIFNEIFSLGAVFILKKTTR